MIDTAWAMVRLFDDSVIGIGQDITERKRVEKRLRASEQRFRQLSGRLVHAQDEERRRIARELHASTAQDLAALTMCLGRLQDAEGGLTADARKAVDEAAALADQAIADVRRHTGVDARLEADRPAR
jgi:signal transduction histidine kinase